MAKIIFNHENKTFWVKDDKTAKFNIRIQDYEEIIVDCNSEPEVKELFESEFNIIVKDNEKTLKSWLTRAFKEYDIELEMNSGYYLTIYLHSKDYFPEKVEILLELVKEEFANITWKIVSSESGKIVYFIKD